MSTLARPTRPHAARQPAEPTRLAAIRWSIARAAAHSAWPELISSPVGAPILLEWRLECAPGAVLHGGAFLVDGDKAVQLLCLTVAPESTWTEVEHGLEHIDIRGLLSASIRIAGRRAGLLYARTALLAHWNIPGGRYEAIGVPSDRQA